MHCVGAVLQQRHLVRSPACETRAAGDPLEEICARPSTAEQVLLLVLHARLRLVACRQECRLAMHVGMAEDVVLRLPCPKGAAR